MIWKRLLTSLVSTILILAALEAIVRVAATLAHRAQGMRYDAELGWRPLPHVRKIGQVWGVSRPATSNALGWRDRERTVRKLPERPRVLAIGDSVTFGASVDDGERFTDVLERQCGAIEVVNIGVPGYGPDQELRLVETEAFEYQPDLLLLTVFLGNDLDDIQHDVLYSWPKPYYTLTSGRLTLVKPRRSFDLALRNLSYLYEIATRAVRDVDLESEAVRELAGSDPVPLFDAILHRTVDIARDHHVPIIVVLAYSQQQIASGLSEEESRARAAVASLGVPAFDTYDLFAANSKAGVLYADDHSHWNAQGHGLVARTLCDWPAFTSVVK